MLRRGTRLHDMISCVSKRSAMFARISDCKLFSKLPSEHLGLLVTRLCTWRGCPAARHTAHATDICTQRDRIIHDGSCQAGSSSGYYVSVLAGRCCKLHGCCQREVFVLDWQHCPCVCLLVSHIIQHISS